jgi:cytidylate kinase
MKGSGAVYGSDTKEVAMSIVAISQTMGSLGDEIGREVAQALSYEFADREIISKAAERFGEGVMDLAHATEEKPTLWERLSDTQRHYMTYVEAIILEMGARDNVVLSGRAAAVILGKVRHALRVRITAPASTRARRTEQQLGLVPEAADDLVRQNDRELAARVKFLYHVDWEDALLYDLVINTERLSAGDGARLIREALQSERFNATPNSLRDLKDLSLGTQARAALLANPITRTLQLYPTSVDAHLSISGIVKQEVQRTTAEDILKGIPGVRGVTSEIVVVPRSVLPAA